MRPWTIKSNFTTGDKLKEREHQNLILRRRKLQATPTTTEQYVKRTSIALRSEVYMLSIETLTNPVSKFACGTKTETASKC